MNILESNNSAADDLRNSRLPALSTDNTVSMEASSSSTGYQYPYSMFTPLAMPMPKSSYAAPTFKGRADQLKMFLLQFERLADLHRLTPEQKCTSIGEYCSQRFRK